MKEKIKQTALDSVNDYSTEFVIPVSVYVGVVEAVADDEGGDFKERLLELKKHFKYHGATCVYLTISSWFDTLFGYHLSYCSFNISVLMKELHMKEFWTPKHISVYKVNGDSVMVTDDYYASTFSDNVYAIYRPEYIVENIRYAYGIAIVVKPTRGRYGGYRVTFERVREWNYILVPDNRFQPMERNSLMSAYMAGIEVVLKHLITENGKELPK